MLTGLPLPALLEELAAPREVPGAGSALAVALATAAAVVQMAARLSPESWTDAAGVAAQAEALRERAVLLVDEDADAYRRALEARAAADSKARPEQRDWALGQVTAAAAEPPIALARLAAGALAAAVARGARELVATNLTALAGDPRVEEADRLVAAAEAISRTL